MLRQLRKSPVFARAAVLTWAIGIGANTAIFSLVDQLILPLLPVRDPQQVAALSEWASFTAIARNPGTITPMSYPMYQDVRDHNQVFSQTMCQRRQDFTVNLSSESEVVSGEWVSGNYLSLLGIEPALGRLLEAKDTLYSGGNPFVVLGYSYWVNHFGADRRVIGRTIRVKDYPLTIVGVIRSGFDGLEPGLRANIFVPITMAPLVVKDYEFGRRFFDRRLRWVTPYGRLRPGVTIAQARAGLQPLFHQILEMEVRQAHSRNEDARAASGRIARHRAHDCVARRLHSGAPGSVLRSDERVAVRVAKAAAVLGGYMGQCAAAGSPVGGGA